MGYYINSDGDYYEGDRVSASDTEVTQRPYHTCTWNAGLSVWEYDLAETRLSAKKIWNEAASADIQESLDAEGITANISFMYLALFVDSVSYTDNAANNTPFYDGYLAVSGLANKAAVHAAIKNDYDLGAVALGKVMAQRDIDFDLIDAAATGPDILAVVYVSPL